MKDADQELLVRTEVRFVRLNLRIVVDYGVGDLIEYQLSVQLMRDRRLALHDEQAELREHRVDRMAVGQINRFDVFKVLHVDLDQRTLLVMTGISPALSGAGFLSVLDLAH